ncbi:MAG: hypothetical protein HYV63_25690 [Candidatus Schekmanbacteria bacterium]|nr:hypothetical protein [Candidatus Schekmanbacteria bacterium]
MSGRGGGWRRPPLLPALLIALCTAAGAAIRYVGPAATGGQSRPDGGYYDADSYYHLRRIEEMFKRWPALPPRDFGVYYPGGHADAWPPLFDLGAAGLAVVRGCGSQWSRGADGVVRNFCLDGTASAYSVLWGVVAIGAGAALAVRLFGWWAGVLASLFLALLPGSVMLSIYSRIDHHGFEQAMGAIVLLAALSAVGHRRLPARWGGDGRGAAADAGMLGLALGVFLLGWMGAFVVVAPLLLWGGVHVFGAAGRRIRAALDGGDSGAHLATLSGGFAVAVVVAGPFYALWSQFPGASIWGPTRLQPEIFLAAAAAAALLAAAAAHARAAATAAAAARVRRFCVVLPGIAGAGLFSLNPDAFIEYFLGGLGLGARQGWYRYAAEMQPMYVGPLGFDLVTPHEQLGSGLLLAPLALIALWLRAARVRRSAREVAMVVIWTGVFYAMSMRSLRFYALGMCAQSAVLAWGILYAGAVVSAAARRRFMGFLTAVLIVLLIFLPTLSTIGRLFRGEAAHLPAAASVQVARFLRDRTPDPGTAWGQRPGYGVMAPADDCHLLLHVSKRPMVFSPFGGNFAQMADVYMAEDAEALLAAMRKFRARYVVTEFYPPRIEFMASFLQRGRAYFSWVETQPGSLSRLVQSTPEVEKLLLVRLHLFGPKGVSAELAARFKPVFASPETVPMYPAPIPRYRVFAFADPPAPPAAGPGAGGAASAPDDSRKSR